MSVDVLAGMVGGGGGVSFDTGIVESVPDAAHLMVDVGERSVPVSVPASMVGAAGAGAVVRLSRQGDAYTLDSVLSAPSATLVPVGGSIMWWTTTLPPGWLWCNGATFDAATYPALAAALGTTTLPDMRGRFPVGHSAGHADFGTLKGTGGATDVTLTVDQMPAHAHVESWAEIDGSKYAGSKASGGYYSGDDMSVGTSASKSEGGGKSHENLPPYLVCNWIIRGA